MLYYGTACPWPIWTRHSGIQSTVSRIDRPFPRIAVVCLTTIPPEMLSAVVDRCQQFDYPTLTDDPKEELEVSAKHPLQFFSISDVDGEDVTAGSPQVPDIIFRRMMLEQICKMKGLGNCEPWSMIANPTSLIVRSRPEQFGELVPLLPDTIGIQ